MDEIRNGKEYKAVERALMRRLKAKLDPDKQKKAKPDAVIRDLVRRYMDAWTIAQDAMKDIETFGHYLMDDRGRRYSNPAMKSLADAEALMDRLQKSMDIKTEDLAAAMEEEDEL